MGFDYKVIVIMRCVRIWKVNWLLWLVKYKYILFWVYIYGMVIVKWGLIYCNILV